MGIENRIEVLKGRIARLKELRKGFWAKESIQQMDRAIEMREEELRQLIEQNSCKKEE